MARRIRKGLRPYALRSFIASTSTDREPPNGAKYDALPLLPRERTDIFAGTDWGAARFCTARRLLFRGCRSRCCFDLFDASDTFDRELVKSGICCCCRLFLRRERERLATTGDKHGDESISDVEVVDVERAEYDGGARLSGDRESIGSIAAECGDVDDEGCGGISMLSRAGTAALRALRCARFGSGMGGSSDAEK